VGVGFTAPSLIIPGLRRYTDVIARPVAPASGGNQAGEPDQLQSQPFDAGKRAKQARLMWLLRCAAVGSDRGRCCRDLGVCQRGPVV
jgi:hypothetical protein